MEHFHNSFYIFLAALASSITELSSFLLHWVDFVKDFFKESEGFDELRNLGVTKIGGCDYDSLPFGC
ncbi:MAG: hypothetical protein ABSE16_14960 [Verrucomicrobiota bacterium]|jgi:hypothetical protein